MIKTSTEAANLLAQVIVWRDVLHQNPELSHNEYKTTEYIISQLQLFNNLHISRPTATGVIARLKGALPGKTIAFRADIDALPIQEKNDTPYRSNNKGIMHACGHDAHSAMLLGAAKVLSANVASIKGEIVFIFQRGEEMSPGGAKELVDLGVLSDVEMFFALHVLPELPCGVFELKQGVASANRDTFHIEIAGKGGHSSMPHLSRDPIVAASEIILALQTIVAREINPSEAAVISVCSFIAGDGSTAAIPNNANICGTNRTFSHDVREQIKAAMQRIVSNTATAHRCLATLTFDNWDYSAIFNDENLCKIAEQVIHEQFGKRAFHAANKPMLIGEDFSEYQAIAPVCFAWFGIGTEGTSNPPLHSSCFNPNESSFIYGVKYFLGLANKLLM